MYVPGPIQGHESLLPGQDHAACNLRLLLCLLPKNIIEELIREAVKSVEGEIYEASEAIEVFIDKIWEHYTIKPFKLDLIEVRKVLESWAASRAAQRAGRRHIEHIEVVFEELKEDFETDTLGVDADARFHLAIYEATGNTILCHIGFTLFDILWQSQKLTRESMFKEEVNKRRLLEQHEAIFQAIREGAPRKARFAILAHLNFAKKKILELAA